MSADSDSITFVSPNPVALPRRTLNRAGLWTLPVIAVAAAAPAMAASAIDLAITVPALLNTTPNGTVNVPFTITNVGGVDSNGSPVIVTIPKPSNGTLVAGTLPAGWSVNDDGSTLTATYTGGVIPAGSALTLPLTYTGGSPGSATITGTIAPNSGGDSNTANNVASTSVAIASLPPDLRATLNVSTSTVSPNGSVQAVYNVTNIGLGPTNGSPVPVTIVKPTGGGTWAWAPQMIPAGWTKTAENSGTITYTYSGVIPPGASHTLVLLWTRTGFGAGVTPLRETITNGAGGDTNNGNNTSTVILNLT